MIFRKMQEFDGWKMIDYSTTWKYGYDLMLDFAQTLINIDFQENTQRLATAETIGAKDIEHLDEVKSVGYYIRKCEAVTKECGVLTVAGVSHTMNCPIQIVLFNQTNALRVFCPKKEIFAQYGDHVFDNYLNSLEIRAYCRQTERKMVEEQKKKENNINQEAADSQES